MTLAEYLHKYLGGLANQLEWEVETGSYDFIVSEAIRLYGVDTEAEATTLDKLYTIAKVVLWESVLNEISFDYDYTANGASFKRSQMAEQVKENLESARTEAMEYLENFNTISVGTLGGDDKDPYSNYPYEDRYT